MRRRSILKWIVLTALSLTVVFMLSTIVHDETAAAANQQNQTPTQGSLQAFDKDGKPAGGCPLKHTDVKAQVTGFLSRVTVTQEFENNFPNKIEAVYVFPLPAAAAVDDLTMVIGERTIKGKIMRREDAQTAYNAAKQMGHVASLLNQEQANVFTQQVANIMPGQNVRITISYVETLQYEDGSYEWTFPMVVAPRYVPGADANQQSIPPTNAQEEMRAGHDISLEIELDAGVSIVAVNSQSHETEVQQIDEKRAVVRLKDRATIPNKDFLLTYRVAGDSINDAVLAHRSERGGFFTLILQPPQRVAVENVMPKELVFVLDTSGSMSGFPIEKAKETMDLALSTLNPHDTFNLITFAGDTEILFPNPVPATRQNLQKAKTFLAGQQGNGGTEMMKAIIAALAPSDSQQHVRIACFLTDGQVANEADIIAEVQKHSNARVFAMGFGPAPNRHLLDKIGQYGRGEVNYVAEVGNTSAVARLFNDRVRSPLLTDISIEWSDLPVTEIYPKRIPDLFSARPLVISGRYTKGGKGKIWLKGKMAGQDFVREIPVELPETENDHDVLANLWARLRIEDLVDDEMANAQNQPVQDQVREEITKLGLEFKLMTKYTSFVAIDDAVFTGPEDPVRVTVPVQTQSATVGTVFSASAALNMSATVVVTSSTTGNLLSTSSIRDLPIQGRSVAGLYTLTPSVVPSSTNASIFSVNGQRSSSNLFVIDGIDANFGIAPGGESPGTSASGSMPALTASGGVNSLATLEATQEVKVQNPLTEAEYGRLPGGQMEIVTRSGTNDYHGSLFHFFGNDALDANDWFANSRGLKQPAKRLNSFGGTFAGPIKNDHTFFFASYEGMRLRQPMVGITDVPSIASRAGAIEAMQPFLNMFSVPNGASRPDGFAEFASSFANPARHDVGSFNIDHSLNSNTMLHGRYNFADSDATLRGPNGLSLNTLNRIENRSQMITGSLSHTFTSNTVFDFRANYSRSPVNGTYFLDDFGGAVIPATPFPALSVTFDLNSRNAAWMFGDEQSNLQRQFNLNGSVVHIKGNHTLKFGSDYRRLSPSIDLRASELNAFFDGVDQASTGVATRVNLLRFGDPQNPAFHNFSLFAQDDWRITTHLTLNYGVRWELAPPPSTDRQAFAVDQVNDPTTLKLAEPGSSLWATRFLNFAPRVGASYEITSELILRGGAGIVYDMGGDRSADIFANSIPFVSGGSVFNSPFPVNAIPNSDLPFMAFDPTLKAPYVISWNASLQQRLGAQTIFATYLGSSGKRLLHTETLLDQNPDFSFLCVTTNRGKSDYRALQLKFERPFTNHFAGLVSYTWSRSMDNVTDDSARRVMIASFDRVPSDFDVRHLLTGFATYELPAPVRTGIGNKLFRNWAVDSIFNARSAKPLKFVSLTPTLFGVAYLQEDVSQRGFPLYQVDMALRRKFNFSEAVGLQIQGDAFNVFNHPNFEDPTGNDLVVGTPFVGQSASMSGRSLVSGGFPSFYSFGGPRSMRFSVKLVF
jgi:Ca-activated chloride channel homolog